MARETKITHIKFEGVSFFRTINTWDKGDTYFKMYHKIMVDYDMISPFFAQAL